ncbi:hypothetical protein L218DRAFT_245177 [Marasmius fiardii PR-910]|nr:hypothetical protein L218DRAFT_245177 [Marasmius fiardii PR-910]
MNRPRPHGRRNSRLGDFLTKVFRNGQPSVTIYTEFNIRKPNIRNHVQYVHRLKDDSTTSPCCGLRTSSDLPPFLPTSIITTHHQEVVDKTTSSKPSETSSIFRLDPISRDKSIIYVGSTQSYPETLLNGLSSREEWLPYRIFRVGLVLFSRTENSGGPAALPVHATSCRNDQ